VTSLSFNLFALASTIAHNSDPRRNSPGRIERFVQSENLPPKLRPRIREQVREQIIEFTEGLDDQFSTLESFSGGSNSRIGVGVYYYEDDE
jgi:hypothetical protein